VAGWRRIGLSDAEIRSLIRSGDLVRVLRGVYATKQAIAFGSIDERRGHALLAAAVQRRTPKAVISHHSAARIHGFDMLEPPGEFLVTVTLPPIRKYTSGPHGVIRHRAALPAGHVETFLGVLLTKPPRTVIDIARTSTFQQGVVVADSALRNEATHTQELREMAAECRRWPGIERALQVAEFADPGAESVLESCARVVFRDHGLPLPQLQTPLCGQKYRADFCWPGQMVIVEMDGLAKYADNAGMKVAAQTKRDNDLRRLGYEVIHVTWAELFGEPGRVVEAIWRALRRNR
jgi:very-short-patch-repair endonuclease